MLWIQIYGNGIRIQGYVINFEKSWVFVNFQKLLFLTNKIKLWHWKKSFFSWVSEGDIFVPNFTLFASYF